MVAPRALERLGLTPIADRLAGLLSHGDQRLLEVAMALAQEPRLLLLDEPTQGLSVEETAQAVETLSGLLADGKMTVLLVEHDMEVVFRLAHQITVLHRGAVILDARIEPIAVTLLQDRYSETRMGELGGIAYVMWGAAAWIQGNPPQRPAPSAGTSWRDLDRWAAEVTRHTIARIPARIPR